MNNTATPKIPLKGLSERAKDMILASSAMGKSADEVIGETLNKVAENTEFVSPEDSETTEKKGESK